ncbi:MAG: DUF3387 domain-containing protein [Gemmatimonadaceae bacterium]|nr:DUF3387 domain-containing protein [Gemmatimonadaceae bacterium]
MELLEKLLRDEIKARARNNVVQEKKYGDRLLETLRKYHNRAIETAQVIEELIQMAKEFQAVLERGELLWASAWTRLLSMTRWPITRAPCANWATTSLRRSPSRSPRNCVPAPRWTGRCGRACEARLRILVRRTLQRWKYPPDQQMEAVELVLKQAEELSNEWSR